MRPCGIQRNAIQRLNHHPSNAIVFQVDRLLTDNLYHLIYLSLFATIFSGTLYFAKCFQVYQQIAIGRLSGEFFPRINTVASFPYRRSIKDTSKTGLIMETLWCSQKTSIVNWINNGESNCRALAPCVKAECDRWRGGLCIHINRTRKPERPQVFSRQDP